MVRSELIEKISEQCTGIKKNDIDLAVQCILDTMSEALSNGGRIEIRGFGVFSLHHQKERLGRNPKSGEPVSIPAKTSIHFKPGKDIRDKVNESRLKS